MLKAPLCWGRGRRARPGRWAGLVMSVTALGLAQGAPGQELNSKLESLIGTSRLGGARIGVSVIDLSSGRTLGDLRAEAPLIPASNMKVLTSGAALLVLGDEFVFKTELLLDGERLVIRGGGDPALADPAILDRMKPPMSVDGLIEMLAGAVKRAGATHIAQIVIDDRVFDRQYVHPSWPTGQLDKWYCAEVNGLNFHTNVLSAFPGPGGERDRPASYVLEPTAPWLEIDNRAKTVTEGENSVWLTREPDANRFTMFGKVRYTTKVPVEITLHEVGTFAGQLLAAELPRSGIGIGAVAPVSGKGRLSREELQAATSAVRLAAPGEIVAGKSIAVVTTHIRDVLERCNNDSQNLYAESLIKRVGHEVTGEPGSWTNGSSVVRMTIKEHLGAEFAASTVVADGSGMSREDQVAPKTLTRWLEMLQKDPKFGEEFVSSLATPGDGTLRRRFGDIKLHSLLRAKSGKLDGVRCLSGFLTDPQDGHRVAFSVMVNDLKEGEQALHALQFHEDVVALCDRWLAAQRSPDQKPAPARAARADPSQSRTRGR
jgi:serine-type D-Ala-D-Ala carboxypeptidase/endopeptidase (penicillin-binding protein 4)